VVAEEYYAKVYARDDAKSYPPSILQLALMQKQNGKYDRAFETFKLAKRKYEKDKNDFLYKKAVQEIDATAWAIKNFSDTVKPLEALPESVNTANTEFGHVIHDNYLIFSSLRADSINYAEEVFGQTYKTHLFRSKIENGVFKENERINDLFNQKLNSGNGTFSIDGKRFYYSACEDDSYNYKCKILVSKYENGKWSSIDTLGKEINEVNKNATMPCISNIDGKEVLFFASDKSGSKGGLDIWMAQMNGNKPEKIQNLSEINTMENDITPWYDTLSNKLYFSSTWHYGFGGQDVFYSEFPFNKVVNAGLPINSSANDQYFFIHRDTNYVSSNRLGTKFAKNPTCCSDIFAKYPKIEIKKVVSTNEDSLSQTSTKITTKLPVRLYFRNDEPDEDSWANTTKQNYLTTYDLYKKNYDKYLQEVGKDLNPELAEKKRSELVEFFNKEVDKGAKDLIEFSNLLLDELSQGSKIILTIKGFASPLAKTNYNVNLTKRRISSLVNHFKAYNQGEFQPYLNGTASNGGKLIFEFVPFGEFTANQETSDEIDNPKESVFSKEAGIERKLHIEQVTFEKNKDLFPFNVNEHVFNAGVIKSASFVSGTFTLYNRSSEKVSFKIINNDSNLSVFSNKMEVDPLGNSTVNFKLDTTDMKGFYQKSFLVEVPGQPNKLELFITLEVK
jgi:hypothetical protein